MTNAKQLIKDKVEKAVKDSLLEWVEPQWIADDSYWEQEPETKQDALDIYFNADFDYGREWEAGYAGGMTDGMNTALKIIEKLDICQIALDEMARRDAEFIIEAVESNGYSSEYCGLDKDDNLEITSELLQSELDRMADDNASDRYASEITYQIEELIKEKWYNKK